MFNYKNTTLNLVLTLLGLITLPSKVLAYDFSYSPEEKEIYNTDFNSNSGWSLNGTTINSNQIYSNSPWATASYSIKPINLDLGDVFLYWSGIFPQGAHRENDKYYVGLQYADNAPVCYNNVAIVGTPPCIGSSVVDENAELKVEMRPIQSGNSQNTYHRVYIDPSFDPISNYSPASTQLNVPKYTEGQSQDFRLKISKVSSTAYEAVLSFWDAGAWSIINAKPNYLPLTIKPSDWIDANQQIENPVTFEAINLQFRQATTVRNSAITSLALTQIRRESVTVPENYSIIGLPLVMGFGILLKRQIHKY